MTFDSELIAKILSPIISIIVGAVVKHYSEAQAKVVTFYGHVSSFSMKDKDETFVNAHSVVIRNAGRKAAQNVRVSHAILPEGVSVYPNINYSISTNPDGASEIVFPVLVPKEQVTISYLYYPPLTYNQINTGVKSDVGFATVLHVIPMPQPSKPMLALIWSLIFLGACFVFYWLIRLAIHVI